MKMMICADEASLVRLSKIQSQIFNLYHSKILLLSFRMKLAYLWFRLELNDVGKRLNILKFTYRLIGSLGI